ncbi:hypothetical protein DFH08DRAFT_916603 [Mycena albidolilacea]|uniref:MYND-type domain-containing protein n=1 Tax=Mycena albidolilacea TaxID=1033008 RepID=A0AAD7EKB7_9AGAR|nr:hypothetical protein DFH08DRAFT_916603 [Mycena albidolilacea]
MPRPGFGFEGFMGIGGGTVSKESEANLKRGQELIEKRKPTEALPFLLKAMEDPNNLDASSSVALMLPQDLAIEFLQKAELNGRRHLHSVLGPDCFELTSEYGAPHFWGILETRPYMRLLGTLVRSYVDAGRWNEAHHEHRILRICQSDNMGQPLARERRSPPGSGIDFSPPRRTPMTDAQIAKMNKWVDLQVIYSAALAAFTLDGDSSLARQYLHMAAQYPLVLIKVIGKFQERADVDTHPTRTMNGSEDARDHLWLAQDLWMQDAPWNWVSRDPFVQAWVLRECSNVQCKKREERVGQWQKCAGCKQQWYCSRVCQKSHWPDHKKACKETQRREESMRMW